MFVFGGYNENSYTKLVCSRIKAYLTEKYGVGCVIGNDNAALHVRADAAKEEGCGLYVAIHTSCSRDCTASGTICYYHPDDSASVNLATAIAEELTRLCTVRESAVGQARDGMLIHNALRLTEIHFPYEQGITPVLVEINAHDNKQTCEWLVNAVDQIAISISEALCAALRDALTINTD